MSSMPPDAPENWPTPDPDDRPTMLLRQGSDRDLELIVRPGANARALGMLLNGFPSNSAFVECFGDVDVMLLFRPEPEGIPTPRVPTDR